MDIFCCSFYCTSLIACPQYLFLIMVVFAYLFSFYLLSKPCLAVWGLVWMCNTCVMVTRRDRQAYQPVDNLCHRCTTHANNIYWYWSFANKVPQKYCMPSLCFVYEHIPSFFHLIGLHFVVTVGIFVATCGIVKYFYGTLCPHYILFDVNASCVLTVVSSSDWQQCLHIVSVALS